MIYVYAAHPKERGPLLSLAFALDGGRGKSLLLHTEQDSCTSPVGEASKSYDVVREKQNPFEFKMCSPCKADGNIRFLSYHPLSHLTTYNNHPSSHRPSPTRFLNNVIPPASRRPRITIRSRDRAFLQQPHKLAHRIRNHHLRIALHEDIQLGVLTRLRLLARGVEASFGRDGRAGRFEDLSDVGAVRDGPASFFCFD